MKTRIEEREEYVPTALRQVWEWKDSIYQETKHLSTRDALRYISERAAEVARQFDFRVAKFPDETTAGTAKLAETPPPHRAKKQ
ncbi:MAG: hypothetical protein MUF81_16545 [Verrucomicrobia bacterium]|jgi:hypothetical protein|nr:hypothetical protein [Verrucomicrobiota bacterium]